MPQPLHKGMLQKYIYLDHYVDEAAFMVISRMVNCSLSTVYSKIRFLPYLQELALNRIIVVGRQAYLCPPSSHLISRPSQ